MQQSWLMTCDLEVCIDRASWLEASLASGNLDHKAYTLVMSLLYNFCCCHDASIRHGNCNEKVQTEMSSRKRSKHSSHTNTATAHTSIVSTSRILSVYRRCSPTAVAAQLSLLPIAKTNSCSKNMITQASNPLTGRSPKQGRNKAKPRSSVIVIVVGNVHAI